MKSEILLNLKQSIYLPIKYSFIALYHPKRKGAERLTHCTVGTKLQFEKKKKQNQTNKKSKNTTSAKKDEMKLCVHASLT